ncbi:MULTISPECIES: nitronate monooxygenase [Kitasatospora]|uniref:Propionate 3-nitronate monooxygenase n=1 Tax=Kitasatospora setae (strain ATCC 33774 / DSM 43861 / JCM 3304 / KCC A-0304 / NBRC 14216 / KM-6054) TaxID=452652 RepID=E4N2S3_KITSK|nr:MULTISPECIES: nitronate monooxygenase [Kitasatospora]BAJ32457.1 putative 2-nitropropane dioxygenase [Kitasatospora setae KM-6054]
MDFDWTVPLVAAPMAGGASTPELVAAVNGAGALGFLAAGYRDVDGMLRQLRAARESTSRPIGMNLFVPGPPAAPGAVDGYRERLLPEARRWGVELPAVIPPDRDGWDAKLEALLREPVEWLSYTFGLPEAAEAAAVRAAGIRQLGTVTSPEEARAASALGLDALVVQGPDAGGHRATHRAEDVPGTLPLPELLAAVRAVTDLPLIAAGGLGDGAAIAAALDAGAAGAQLGTAYLRTDESGASAAHRRALLAFDATAVTRAFTGRPARGLRNAFVERHEGHAPAAYPEVHHLTQPLRAAAGCREDLDAMHLWAGTAHRLARAGGAADVTRALWRETGRA